MLDTLAFDVAIRTLATENAADEQAANAMDTVEATEPCRGLVVTPRVNGVPLIATTADSPVFDATCVLGQQMDTASFLPYTCGCGIPECAGVFLRAHMRVAEDTVTWRFPEEPFREKMADELVATRQPIAFRFDREQYVAALQDLAQQLHPYFAGTLPAGHIIGIDDLEHHAGWTIEQMLEKFRAAHLKRLPRQEARERLFGPLVDATIRMTWPDGAQFGLHIESLAEHLAYEEVPVLEEARDAAKARAAAGFQLPGEELCAKVKEMGFRSLEQYASLIEPGMWDWDKDPEGGIEWLAARWDKVKFELVPSEMIGA